MKHKKLTAMQKAFQKEVNRIKRFIRNAEKRGYFFDDYQLPTRPKRVTQKSLQAIQQTKPKNLYEVAKAADQYGEQISGTEARKIERSISAKKAAQSRRQKRLPKIQDTDYTYFPSESTMVISNFKAEISNFPTFAQPVLNQWLSNVIAQHGSDAAAEMLQEGKDKGLIVNWEVAYKEGMLQEYMTEMLEFIPDIGQLEKEALIEAFEQEENWAMPQ